MTAYAAFELFFTDSTMSARDFWAHHFLPAAVIGSIVWVTLTVLLHKLVVEPVRQIFGHLYRIGSGRLEPLEMDSRIQEIRSVAEGVNLLVRRLKTAPDNAPLERAIGHLGKVRSDMSAAIDAAGSDADHLVAAMSDLAALEADLLAVAETSRSLARLKQA